MGGCHYRQPGLEDRIRRDDGSDRFTEDTPHHFLSKKLKGYLKAKKLDPEHDPKRLHFAPERALTNEKGLGVVERPVW